jgi:glutamine amidotransferase
MKETLITIVDYGLGNLGSIQNILKRIGAQSVVTSDADEIKNAEKIILPGVGSFDTAMRQIDELGLKDVLIKKAKIDNIPILGICLGMQLLTRGSEEGKLSGLNLIPAKTVKFEIKEGYKVPHMGWNKVLINTKSEITKGFDDEFRFYFVHSYKVQCDNPINSILKANYGGIFDAAIQHGNIYGVQFHPEKSHKFGKKLLSNFVNI